MPWGSERGGREWWAEKAQEMVTPWLSFSIWVTMATGLLTHSLVLFPVSDDCASLPSAGSWLLSPLHSPGIVKRHLGSHARQIWVPILTPSPVCFWSVCLLSDLLARSLGGRLH